MVGWLINLVISFAIKQLAKFGIGVNWDLVKADYGARLAKLIPGDILDDEAVFVFGQVIDVIESVVSSAEVLSKLVELVKEKNLEGAIELLKSLVLDVVLPGKQLAEVSEVEMVSALKSYKKASA